MDPAVLETIKGTGAAGAVVLGAALVFTVRLLLREIAGNREFERKIIQEQLEASNRLASALEDISEGMKRREQQGDLILANQSQMAAILQSVARLLKERRVK